jgi:Collagen triple helix repeat (20 copies).
MKNKSKIITVLAVIVLSLATLLSAAACTADAIAGPQGLPGPQGLQGEPGLQGPQGAQGEQGAAGLDGLDGLPGANGLNGQDGRDASSSLSNVNNITVDYRYLPKENVFTTVTFHDLYHLVYNPRVIPGEYVVFIGGTWDENSQQVISLVDKVVRAKGINDIYRFDPKLDAGLAEKIVGKIGADAADPANIGKIGYTYVNPDSVNNSYKTKTDYLYDDLEISKFRYSTSFTALELLQRYIQGANQIALNADGTVKTPQIIVVQKEQATQSEIDAGRAINANILQNDTGVSEGESIKVRWLYDQITADDDLASGVDYVKTDVPDSLYEIVDGLKIYDDASLAKTVFSHRYATLKGVFTLDSVTPGARKYFVKSLDGDRFISQFGAFIDTNVIKANLKVYDPFTVKNQVQPSGGGTTRIYENVNAAGKKLLVTVTFEEFVKILQSEGDQVIYWGGLWCPNSAALYAGIQAEAVKSGYEGQIYLFDPKPAGNGRYIRDIDVVADSAQAGSHARLYSYLLDNFFPGYYSRWNTAGTNYKRSLSVSDNGSTPIREINGKDYTRIVVPSVALYNRDLDTKLVDIFESELTWNQSSSLASNVYHTDSVAFNFRKIHISNLFAKVGVTEKFLEEGYRVSVEFVGLEGYLTAYKSDTDYLELTSYYYLDLNGDLNFNGAKNFGPSAAYGITAPEPYPRNLTDAKAADGALTQKQGSRVLYKAQGEALTILQDLGY